MTNIAPQLNNNLPAPMLQSLHEISEIAEAKGNRIYLVGGIVRDLLLDRPNLDLDMVVEGNAIALARQIGKSRGWATRTHPHFGTAKLITNDFSIDLVTARSETYAHPGALPKVQDGTIEDDLLRRDFTINAIAAHMTTRDFGNLIDPYGGQADLGKGIVRTLHNRSFKDDPTRIIRAIRYEQRLGFRIEKDTEAWLLRDMHCFDAVTGERLWHELERIFEEEYPEKSLLRAGGVGALRAIHPHLVADDNTWLEEKFRQARSSGDESLSLRMLYIALLTYRLEMKDAEDLISRLKMAGWATKAVRDADKLKRILHHFEAPDLKSSEIYKQLHHHLPEVIATAALATESILTRQRLTLYLSSLRHLQSALTGDDLIRMGAKPGKGLGQLLSALHQAKLDGMIDSRDEESAFARKLLQSAK